MIEEMLHNIVEVFKYPNLSKTHYKMTPYSFNPRTAKKLTINPHSDLGQGILNLIEEIAKNNIDL